MSNVRSRIAASLLLATLCGPALGGEASSDGPVGASNTSFFHAPGADDFGATAPQGGTIAYLFIAGSALHPRTSGQAVTYEGGGCIASDGAVTTDLQLPDGAFILGVRTYYYNMGQPGDLVTYVTIYDGAGVVNDLLSEASTLDSGFVSEHFELSPPATVDNISQSYVLTASIDAGLELCGMRVFYEVP